MQCFALILDQINFYSQIAIDLMLVSYSNTNDNNRGHSKQFCTYCMSDIPLISVLKDNHC